MNSEWLEMTRNGGGVLKGSTGLRKAVSALRYGRVPRWWNQREESGNRKGSAAGLGMRLRNLPWRTGRSVNITCLISRPECQCSQVESVSGY